MSKLNIASASLCALLYLNSADSNAATKNPENLAGKDVAKLVEYVKSHGNIHDGKYSSTFTSSFFKNQKIYSTEVRTAGQEFLRNEYNPDKNGTTTDGYVFKIKKIELGKDNEVCLQLPNWGGTPEPCKGYRNIKNESKTFKSLVREIYDARP